MNTRIKASDISKWNPGAIVSGKVIMNKSAVNVIFSTVDGIKDGDSIWIPKELKDLFSKFKDGEQVDITFYGKSDLQVEGLDDLVEFGVTSSKKAA